jgi:hypothetical protein
MNLELLRYSDNKESTLGLLFLNGKFFCHTLEDEYREIKVRGETRIPEGTYKLGIRKADTPLTIKYRQRYGFFKYHIEILNVKNFTGIYIHPGNSDAHTEGCVLLGHYVNNNRLEKGRISDSTRAWQEFYELMYPHLDKGGESTIWIHQYYGKSSV